ncbi:hypothetical protein D0B54_01010 [Solimonas sp. K1W22B-7]|uniref:AAA family ATPase n=1 Tax=Solimonas sp. K1W22B-7 TaxID=2303331 RepID=UPI000E3379B5|nr:AAA family ATPase [Solimonas sp. K1W22B-7]AXQ27353.1 hypothetical protein D0B54_01010 [Solimonas sp. K1W22B-7]
MASTSFNIFDELSSWQKDLPVWQQCLLAKLVATNELSKNDFDQVYRELLIDFGLVSHGGVRNDYALVVPQFNNTPLEERAHLVLMHEVSGVNALKAGQALTFGPMLTVVYGPNGSGKSGYARVLKAACFTRSRDTEILGDVRINLVAQPEPTAKFKFADGTDATYMHKQPCPKLRDNFAVFDSTCIRVHLDERKSFQVMPYLFDVFPRMVDVFSKLQAQLKIDIGARLPVADRFAIAGSESTVGQALRTLSAKTDTTELDKLAVFGNAELDRLELVSKKIQELRSGDSKQIVQQNRQKIADLDALRATLIALSNAIDSDLVSKIGQEIQKVQHLKEKSAALSAAQLGNEPVQPVGTQFWRELIAAAVSYNNEAFPGDSFPPALEIIPRCVLCQQELQNDAFDRLSRFYQVATSDVENQLKGGELELDVLSGRLRKTNTGIFSPDSAARRVLKDLDVALEADVAAHVAQIEALKGALDDSIASLSLSSATPSIDSVSQRIKELSQRIGIETLSLIQKDPETLLAPLLEEKILLEDRRILSGTYTDVVNAVTSFKWVDIGRERLRTFASIQREVTTKQTDLAKRLVAQGFVDKFTENCELLELHLPVKFRFAGDAGKTDRQIEIVSASRGDFEPSDVLSEGEQTAAALADFLTEVEINGSCSGVIFDDPVTSMDHLRKESIAKRLVGEASARQVIVFTHDILFTSYLAAAAAAKGVKFTGHTVCKGEEDGSGCVDVLAFPHEEYEGAAFNRAKIHLNEANLLSGHPQRGHLEKACGNLRTAYEDFIQKKLFGNVVRRWRENITFTLNQVYFDEAIALRVHEKMAVLSRFIDAHSHSLEYQQLPLSAAFVSAEIAEFEKIRGDYTKARKIWESAKPKGEFN